MEQHTVNWENQRMLEALSLFLNLRSDFIDGDMVRQLTEACRVPVEEAYGVLLAGVCGLDISESWEDRRLYERYLRPAIRRQEADLCRSDPYVLAVPFPAVEEDGWSFTRERYRPYEAFACDDFRYMPDGRVLSPLGFFEEEVTYPAVKENGRIWMTVSPIEIHTMRPHVAAAHGRVLTYGLGLGYFAFHASAKPEVTSVTVVERDPRVIRLFRRYLLPHFPEGNKITVVEADAFAYAREEMPRGGYDFVFADTWHDPSDGVEMYRRFRATELLSPTTEFRYWIEDTLRYYL